MKRSAAPLSHHDTLEEAEARVAAYRRGASQKRGELVDLPDGSEVLVRALRPNDKLLFDWATGIEDVDEAIGALHPRTGAGLGVARYLRSDDRPLTAETYRGRLEAIEQLRHVTVEVHPCATPAR